MDHIQPKFLFLSLVPSPWGQWGFIKFSSGIEFTIVHIPVIIGSMFGGKRVALMLGLIFGLGSISAAAIYGGATAVMFLNPLVSILPRVLFGYAIYLLFNLFKNRFKNPAIAFALTAALSTVIHTVLVLSMLFVFYLSPKALFTLIETEQLKMLLLFLLLINLVVEVFLAVAIATPIGVRMKQFKEAK